MQADTYQASSNMVCLQAQSPINIFGRVVVGAEAPNIGNNPEDAQAASGVHKQEACLREIELQLVSNESVIAQHISC